MASEGKQKNLRVGVVSGGKIVEERLLRKRDSVTVGQAARNTFIVPVPQLPRTYTLFEVKAGKYSLVFDEHMEGRVSLGDEIADLRTLARTGKAKKRGRYWVIELSDRSRGKVVIGEITILFQFVDAPPVLPKPQLPAVTRAGLAQRIDWPFFYVLVICFFSLAGPTVGMDVWWRYTGQYLQEKFSQRKTRAYEVLKAEVLRQRDLEPVEETPKETIGQDEQKEAQKEEEKVEEKAEEPEKKGPAKTRPVGEVEERKSERFKRVAAKVRRTTFLHVLGSESNGEGADVFNTLKDGVDTSKLDNAFNLGGGVAMAQPGETGTFVGEPKAVKAGTEAYKRLSKGEAGGRIQTKTVKSGAKESAGKEKRVNISIRGGSLTGQSGTGNIDKASVSRVFNRRKGAIKYCYEKALKVNPSLKGKVTIRFTIGTAGRVTEITIGSNTTGDSSIGQCVIGKVRSWRFPPASGGSVTFSHTFILSSSG